MTDHPTDPMKLADPSYSTPRSTPLAPTVLLINERMVKASQDISKMQFPVAHDEVDPDKIQNFISDPTVTLTIEQWTTIAEALDALVAWRRDDELTSAVVQLRSQLDIQ
jgi:hypothetical protein